MKTFLVTWKELREFACTATIAAESRAEAIALAAEIDEPDFEEETGAAPDVVGRVGCVVLDEE